MSVVSPARINSFELARNQALLDLQSRHDETLRMTQQATVADPSAS